MLQELGVDLLSFREFCEAALGLLRFRGLRFSIVIEAETTKVAVSPVKKRLQNMFLL